MGKIRIEQRYTAKWYKSKSSGHEWSEDTKLNKWDIKTDSGIMETVNSYEKALKLQKEWQEYENKFNL